ncbi:hypothetical protein [Bradyrhizobium sp.]
MSADYETEHLNGYEHGKYVWVTWKGAEDDPWNGDNIPLGSFDPELVAELQAIMDARPKAP